MLNVEDTGRQSSHKTAGPCLCICFLYSVLAFVSVSAACSGICICYWDIFLRQLLSYMPIGSCFPFGHINSSCFPYAPHRALTIEAFLSPEEKKNQPDGCSLCFSFLFWPWKFNECRVLVSFCCSHKNSDRIFFSFSTLPERSFNVVAYDAKLLLILLIFIPVLCVNISQLVVVGWHLKTHFDTMTRMFLTFP